MSGIVDDAKKEQARLESAYEEIREQLRSALMHKMELELQQPAADTELQIQVEELKQRFESDLEIDITS